MLSSQLARVAVLFSVVSLGCFAADNQLTEAESQQGWQLLFDGKDLRHWRNYQSDKLDSRWVIEDGAIKLSGKGGGDIITREQYEDFELKLDWKISEGGNSGVFFWVDEQPEKIYAHAPEVQVLDDARHPDRQIDSHRSGSLYDLLAAPAYSQKPAGEWNTLVIRVQGKHITLWQNGVVTASIVVGSSGWNTLLASSKFADWEGFASGAGGHIGLQDHDDVVWFKNIKVREL